MGVIRDLFGPGTWGTGGNLVAWLLCGAVAGAWLRAKLKAQEALARLHHQQHLAQAQEHHDALIAHVTATATLAVTAADGPVRGGAGSNPAAAGLTTADGPVVPPPAAGKPDGR